MEKVRYFGGKKREREMGGGEYVGDGEKRERNLIRGVRV